MKNIFILILMLGSLDLAMPVFGNDTSKPMLVFDAKNTVSLPRRYRQCTSSYLDKIVQQLLNEGISIPTREGLSSLHTSASGQFSQKQLQEIKKRTPGILWIVDLREESHGYLNGDAISWRGIYNNTNKGLNLQEILAREHTLLGKLRALKTAVVYQIKLKIAHTTSQAYANPIPINSIMSEAKLARLENMHYIRFPVTDHYPPSPEIVQQFISFYKNLPPNAHLLIHCRGGSGRATFFMILCDIIKNGHNLSLKEIVYRQYLLSGKNMLDEAGSSEDDPFRDAFRERIRLLQSLYQQITGKPADMS